MSIIHSLETIGISDRQIKIYRTLLQLGWMRATALAKKVGISRNLVYHDLYELIDQGLVHKRELPGKVALFGPAHPKVLAGKAAQHADAATLAQQSIEKGLGAMLADYNRLAGLGTAQYFEGIEGVRVVQRDILETGEDIFLVRSQYDKQTKQLEKELAEQIQAQTAAGIRTRALVPAIRKDQTPGYANNPDRLIERIAIEKDRFLLPSQIIVYGDKISITNFDPEIATTLIEHPGMATTFRTMFTLVWDLLLRVYEG